MANPNEGALTYNNGELALRRMYVDRDALALFLGPLEAAVMRALWDKRQSTRAIYKHVLGAYTPTNSDELAFTSVTSTVDRLYKRGLLTRSGTSHNFRYSPAIATEAEFVNRCVSQAVGALLFYYPIEVARLVAAHIQKHAKKDQTNGK